MDQRYKVEDIKNEGGRMSIEVQLNTRAAEGWLFRAFQGSYVVFERAPES